MVEYMGNIPQPEFSRTRNLWGALFIQCIHSNSIDNIKLFLFDEKRFQHVAPMESEHGG